MKNLLLIIIVIFNWGFLCGQNVLITNDTLNKFDSLGNKTGYWVEYLSKDFHRVKKIEKATFFRYVRYSNGVCFDLLNNPGNVKVKSNTLETNSSNKERLILLDGNYKLYKKNNTRLFSECIYKNGIIQKIIQYELNGGTIVWIYIENYQLKKYTCEVREYNEFNQLKSEVIVILKNGKWN